MKLVVIQDVLSDALIVVRVERPEIWTCRVGFRFSRGYVQPSLLRRAKVLRHRTSGHDRNPNSAFRRRIEQSTRSEKRTEFLSEKYQTVKLINNSLMKTVWFGLINENGLQSPVTDTPYISNSWVVLFPQFPHARKILLLYM